MAVGNRTSVALTDMASLEFLMKRIDLGYYVCVSYVVMVMVKVRELWL